MKNEIDTQRQSSSTADSTSEINPKASPPLDEASCSASSFFSRAWKFMTNADKRDSEKERMDKFNREQDRKVKEIMDWFARNSLPDSYGGCNQGANTDDPR